ncbi:MAG: winged helix-turn-helix domain-containing protein [Synergistales bacterium]|nr:winged helix-turn-helix domain-containing protein [Synergistales bacterium]
MTSGAEFNSTSIGSAAGDIWYFLEQTGGEGVSVNRLCEELALPKKLVLAALGWLAREGKIDFREEKKKNLIYLA